MPPHCEVTPRWHGSHFPHGVIALTTTRSPSLHVVTFAPMADTTPTLSWPSTRPSGMAITPRTVCTSEVQMSDAVVLMTASFGPGSGMGLSMIATLSMPMNASACIGSSCGESGW